MLAWIAARCLDTSRQRPSAIVAMIFSKLNRSIRSRCLAYRNQPPVRQAARRRVCGNGVAAAGNSDSPSHHNTVMRGSGRPLRGLQNSVIFLSYQVVAAGAQVVDSGPPSQYGPRGLEGAVTGSRARMA
jgi:hypothetical protein